MTAEEVMRAWVDAFNKRDADARIPRTVADFRGVSGEGHKELLRA